MLENLFDVILQMSFYGTVAGVCAAFLCLLLRYLPCSRRVGFLLWAVVALRLVCPFTIPVLQSDTNASGNADRGFAGTWTTGIEPGSSPLDLEGNHLVESGGTEYGILAEQIGDNMQERGGDHASTGRVPAGDMDENQKKDPDFLQKLYFDYAAVYQEGWEWMQDLKPYLAMLWLAGVLAFWGYGIWDAVRIRKQLQFAMKAGEGIYEVDTIRSSCVVGIFRPRIYLIPGLDTEQRKYILCHEQEHIRHRDQIWKPLAYGILGLHWFNIPLWVLYETFQNELERYCDERVVARLGAEKKEDYCEVLLQMSVRRPRFAFSPLAFGENRGKNDMKDRISQILKHKKQNKAVQALLLAGTLGVSAVLLSGGAVLASGTQEEKNASEAETEISDVQADPVEEAVQTETEDVEGKDSQPVENTEEKTEDKTGEAETKIIKTEEGIRIEREDGTYYTYLYQMDEYQSENLAKELFALRNPYVGDASANAALLNALSMYLPDAGISQELETQEEPYRLILNMEEGPDETDQIRMCQYENLDKAAAVLLALIDNVDEVVFSYPEAAKGEEPVVINESYSVQQFADHYDGLNVKDYASSEEKVLELLELLEWDRYYEDAGASLVGEVLSGEDVELDIYAEGETISMIGGADGPTSIFIAGKREAKDSDGETAESETKADTEPESEVRTAADTEPESRTVD